MSFTLQICTVGGAPEPIVASILAHRPERVLFVVSPETKSAVAERIVPDVESHSSSFPLPPSKYDFIILPNAQDFEQCVRELRNAQARYVEPWLGRGADYQVIVDFTGGTKCMTSAVALVARRWNCKFSYVGGTERTKDGVGIVISGKEQIIHAANPWDTFGFEAVEQALLLFNNGEFGGACRILNAAKIRGSEQIKRGLSTLQQLCEGYECWDRFQHEAAWSKFVNVQRTPGDLRDWFPNTNSSLLATLKLHCEWLNRLPADPNAFVLDLIANGVRCEKRGRYDDAVARLYRACEAVAQQRLQTLGFSEAPNGKVAFEKLPDALKNEWRGRSQDGIVRLGLQDDYLLLNTVSDELGMRFEKLGLSDQKRSPLNARNDSILAHGKSPISSDSFNALLEPLLSLVEQDRAALPAFPMLQS